MVIFFFLGLVGFAARGMADGGEGFVLASIVSGVFFACFLILFAIYWIGYLLKGHAVWQAERQAGSDGSPVETDSSAGGLPGDSPATRVTP
ncbi:hypothetical protein [Micromonospora sp. NPDC047187]|uniref:hypothetical protein n=1 Tax=Micromonospora sp. NPDC047187 TaxID=3155262 RepID=UPI0033CA1CBD